MNTAAGAGAGASLVGGVAAANAAEGGKVDLAPSSALDLLRSQPLMNMQAAYDVMAQEGIDGIIAVEERHVYHMTNFWPLLGKMGSPRTCSALLSTNQSLPPALVVPQFTYYYIYQEWQLSFPVEIFVYNTPTDIEAYLAAGDQRLLGEQPEVAGNARSVNDAAKVQGTTDDVSGGIRPFVTVDPDLLTSFENSRYSALESAQQKNDLSAGPEWGLVNAAKQMGLDRGRIAIDHPSTERILRLAGSEAEFVDAENIMRKIRYSRSPAEISISRLAARQNAEAGRTVAKSIEPGMTFREIRAKFYSEAALRGNTGVFMAIDRVTSEIYDGEIKEGQAFFVDCVSHFLHYHGDYARTIFVGEPVPMMQQAMDAISLGWDEIREQLKPGMKYSEVRKIGNDAIRKAGYPFLVAFSPHSVGLFHGDQPGRDGAPYRMGSDLEIVENMVLSVDCPVLNDGIGGSAHLEDLMLITKDGAEPLNDVGDQLIVV